MIILPRRQARDKHRANSKRGTDFSTQGMTIGYEVDFMIDNFLNQPLFRTEYGTAEQWLAGTKAGLSFVCLGESSFSIAIEAIENSARNAGFLSVSAMAIAGMNSAALAANYTVCENGLFE
jgi:hypothetical protein